MAEAIAPKTYWLLATRLSLIRLALYQAMHGRTALQAAMSLQQLGHSHNAQVHGMPVDPRGLEVIRTQAKALS